MNDRCFIDTNIFVYARDLGNPRKLEIASTIVKNAFQNGSGSTSWQVLHEFHVTITRKLRPGMNTADGPAATDALEALEPYPLNRSVLREAWALEDLHSLSFWDALIVAAVKLSHCGILYSEDMGHDAEYGGVRIVNPFLEEPA